MTVCFVLQDVFPMIRELQFEPRFRQAMLTVFGKTLMCRDIDVASQYSKSANLDCVTMEGRFCQDACVIHTHDSLKILQLGKEARLFIPATMYYSCLQVHAGTPPK